MSDFFEMREALERKKADDADRRLHGRIYQAILVLIIGAGVGITDGIRQLEQPVGQVAHVSQTSVTYTMLAKSN